MTTPAVKLGQGDYVTVWPALPTDHTADVIDSLIGLTDAVADALPADKRRTFWAMLFTHATDRFGRVPHA